MTDEFLICNLT